MAGAVPLQLVEATAVPDWSTQLMVRVWVPLLQGLLQIDQAEVIQEYEGQACTLQVELVAGLLLATDEQKESGKAGRVLLFKSVHQTERVVTPPPQETEEAP